ncbi:hypothetical protein Y1Q_0023036 [Alligator mississippiensis]|uniref:Endonuclease/exonuclease/phosphatase domain-containing protein n=1 Tax=Alligator mississippiensis TaxID=8496 RepID=A0A151P8D1_ALLMI|nr:hypothetical protein Y1Q_0023036 [Alligator mississippiensis]
MLTDGNTNRPERRTALIGRELGQITALSKTHLPEEKELTEEKAGYTFFWSGHGTEDKWEAGVSFAIQNSLVKKLTYLPKGVNDLMMVLNLPLVGKKCTTIISAYAPTMANSDEVKNQLYDDLHSVITAVSKSDRLILLGDFNARIGSDCQTWDGVIGKQETWKLQ